MAAAGERIKWLIDRVDDVLVYSIGQACSKKLMESGIVERTYSEAEKHTYDGLVEAVRCRADEKPMNDI